MLLSGCCARCLTASAKAGVNKVPWAAWLVPSLEEAELLASALPDKDSGSGGVYPQGLTQQLTAAKASKYVHLQQQEPAENVRFLLCWQTAGKHEE